MMTHDDVMHVRDDDYCDACDGDGDDYDARDDDCYSNWITN